MIGGLPVHDLRCDRCGCRHEVIWMLEDLTFVCDDCWQEGACTSSS